MIRINNLHVELGEFILKDLDLIINDNEYFIILGPTGAGKTVLLESIAGLNPIKNGDIWLNEKNITDLKPEKREVSIVYQDHALFPHMSVKDNIVFGLKLRKKPIAEINDTLNWLTGLLGIIHLLNRRPQTLSGGEKQKVALARALSTKPEVLLLDEPLSALDPETREEMQEGLLALHNTINNTIVHVTHDFEEAMALGTRMAIIGEGQIRQVGTPEQIFRQPESAFVAQFTLVRNILRGEVKKNSDGESFFKVCGVDIRVNTGIEDPCLAAIRPEDVQISSKPVASNIANIFSGSVTGIIDKGAAVHISVNLPPVIKTLVTRHQYKELGLRVGDKIFISMNPTSIRTFKE